MHEEEVKPPKFFPELKRYILFKFTKIRYVKIVPRNHHHIFYFLQNKIFRIYHDYGGTPHLKRDDIVSLCSGLKRVVILDNGSVKFNHYGMTEEANFIWVPYIPSNPFFRKKPAKIYPKYELEI